MLGFAIAIDPQGMVQPLPGLSTASTTPPGPWTCITLELGRDRLYFYGAVHGRSALSRQLDLDVAATSEGLLATAVRRWPEHWPERLTGPCACAHWSAETARATLWRDASGLLPLYYAQTAGGTLLVATDLTRLAAHLGRRPGGPGLHEYLHLLDIAPPRTIYPGIAAVAAGQRVEWFAHDNHVRVYEQQSSAVSQLSEPQALESLEQRLMEAIRLNLEGAQRPAAFLSSGVDSTLLCALAARQRPDITAITVGFDDARLDEGPSAARIAQHLGLKHEVWRFDQATLASALGDYVRLAEQPMADPAILVTLLAFRQAASRFDVVLDGTGADELLGAMPPRHLRVAVEWASLLPRPLRRLAAGVARHLPGGYAPVFEFAHPAEVLRRWKGFSAAEISALCGEPVALEDMLFYQEFGRFPRSSHFERYSALLTAMPCDRLGYAARMTGLDVRFPYLEPQAASWLRGLPPALRWQPASPKHILRTLLARHLPRELWAGPKRGFDFPLLAFLRYQDHRLVRRYLLETTQASDLPLAREVITCQAERFIAGDGRLGLRIWALILLAAWWSHQRMLRNG